MLLVGLIRLVVSWCCIVDGLHITRFLHKLPESISQPARASYLSLPVHCHRTCFPLWQHLNLELTLTTTIPSALSNVTMDQVDIFANYSTRPTTPTRSKPPTFSSSASSSRPETPAVKSITLAEWEASAPLDEEVMGSVSLLRSACGSRAFPARVSTAVKALTKHRCRQ